MRIVNAAGRLGLLTDSGVIDVAEASGGRFEAEPQSAYARWDELREWAAQLPAEVRQSAARAVDGKELGAPVPRPGQVFGIGLNYRDHAEEAGLDTSPGSMVVFTKFPSSITGPEAEVALPPGSNDFEAELVVVIG
ncbi:fumarylacetoacetate hydrolase, partial [Streptomyces sp. SID11233]|nr:fumarylacetoacetate hydrolase [Streptomyces sp. SID11233]